MSGTHEAREDRQDGAGNGKNDHTVVSTKVIDYLHGFRKFYYIYVFILM